jgi:tetratricopeptide (TPR) repeat protein
MVAATLLAGAPLRAQETTPPTSSPWDETAAKLHYEKGTAAYALGDFVEAAREYEAAFRLKLDPALLFNAAQANRRAGNRQRAIELYANLLRVFPTAAGHEKAQQHLDELRRAAATEPLTTSAPPSTAPPPPLVLREGRPPPAAPQPALYHQTWFLATVAGIVVAGVVTAAVLSVGDRPARPSWGQVGP